MSDSDHWLPEALLESDFVGTTDDGRPRRLGGHFPGADVDGDGEYGLGCALVRFSK
jgi:hypothetical protein